MPTAISWDVCLCHLGQSRSLLVLCEGFEVATCKYWDVSYDIDEEHDQAWFVDHLARLIEDSVRIHLRSDVPIGAHLFGGIDASTVVCLVLCLKTSAPGNGNFRSLN